MMLRKRLESRVIPNLFSGGPCETTGTLGRAWPLLLTLQRARVCGWLALFVLSACPVRGDGPSEVGSNDVLLSILSDELKYAMDHLVADDGTKPYYLAYTVYDDHRVILSASLGALSRDDDNQGRKLNIDLRVGDYSLDNTRQLRGGGPSHESGNGNVALPLTDHMPAIRQALWFNTDRVFKRAVKRLANIKTNRKVKVEEEDQSDDFSREPTQLYFEKPATLDLDAESWRDRLRRVSSLARSHPLIYNSSVTLGTLAATRYLVTSEGTRLRTIQKRYRITLSAGTKAEDGMDLSQSFDFNSASPEGLPEESDIQIAFQLVIDQVLALRAAPLAEPYIGPAILKNRASGVFFHEIFGHRIEGHRQKDVTEGQTFKKKIGHLVLPEFLSVVDDPTQRRLEGIDLRGFYRFDDEGVKAQRVVLVDRGVLKSFLLSRTPLEGFPRSNGHGRRDAGNAVVSRQGNLIVKASRSVSFSRLRDLLIETCKAQGKPYGLLFEDISGGYTTTSRRGPQSFKVLPIVVYKLFADGRPDQLIRGADIVGTPLTCFEKITHAADDIGVFNGTCGAESGWVPVSAISPSILVSTIEIEKRTRNQSRPPILGPPLSLSSQ